MNYKPEDEEPFISFPKPGAKKKSSKIKNKSTRLHDIDKPKDLHCKRCGKETGTERFSHYEGFRKFQFGKGTGQKSNDHMTAWLCQGCSDIMDKNPQVVKNIEWLSQIHHSEEWLYLICKTWLI